MLFWKLTTAKERKDSSVDDFSELTWLISSIFRVQISEGFHVWHLNTGFTCGEKARVLESSSQRQHAFRREVTGRQNQFHWLRQAPSVCAALRRYIHKSSKYGRSPTSNASSYSAMDRDSRLLRRLHRRFGWTSWKTLVQYCNAKLVAHPRQSHRLSRHAASENVWSIA